MKKKIFNSIFAASISVFIATIIIFMCGLYDYFTNVQQQQLKVETDLTVQGVIYEGKNYLNGIATNNYRITWINTDGTVIYDSDINVAKLENHLQREEIQEALMHGEGNSLRYSKSLMERQLYYAKKLPDGTVLRCSITQHTIPTLLFEMLTPIIILIVVALVLSSVLASRLSKRIIKPLNQLNLDEPLCNRKYNELMPLLTRIHTQQNEIARQKSELITKKNEFETLTEGMKEGIILLNSEGTILSINPAAMELFKADDSCIGQDILVVYHKTELIELFDMCQKGKHTEKVVDIEGEKYQLSISPVVTDSIMSGIVLLIQNVTEKEKLEQIRREFTANVSHELKTPLHTISGCSELLANGMVKPDDIGQFAEKIYTETKRLIKLVEDIIKLSHLDEGALDMNFEKINIYQMAKDVLKSIVPNTGDISINLEGEDAYINGIPQLVSGIIYNLCDNAIKYNKLKGKVNISILNIDNNVKLIVADTGIGIPYEDKERVFERFYRVDKSHSKEIGGTGLGLSIVKHAVRLHNAKIIINSTLGEGTTFEVIFPKYKNN